MKEVNLIIFQTSRVTGIYGQYKMEDIPTLIKQIICNLEIQGIDSYCLTPTEAQIQMATFPEYMDLVSVFREQMHISL